MFACVCVLGKVNGGNTAASYKQNEWTCTNRVTRAIHFFVLPLPTSFWNGSLHDDRPVSIRYSKRSHRIFVVPNWVYSSKWHSKCLPILQSIGLIILKRCGFLSKRKKKKKTEKNIFFLVGDFKVVNFVCTQTKSMCSTLKSIEFLNATTTTTTLPKAIAHR